ncbi:sickle tail protein homolog isoform X15 [Oryzias latipes]|uniref:sickle tail protein homolog isoform X15 n=1 Tax=Oryzias latipes TaxID=8090 RepID=UPI000CE24D53|nr:sickle tail protein homolog isoform X15 [Oryzias latipes]
MSKASRLARPSSAGPGSKLPSPRKEFPGTANVTAKARLLGVGEKLMRAGNDGVLNRQKASAETVRQEKEHCESQAASQSQKVRMVTPKTMVSSPKASSNQQVYSQKQTKSNLKVTSPEDAEHVSRRQASPNGTPPSKGDAKGSRAVPRRHTLGGARSSQEILAMQPSDMDKKREAFLEHLKHKYPHHASAIMGHQERLRDQSRSPKHGASPQPSVGDQVDHLSLASLESLDTMSEAEAPTAFTRGSRVRASLPVVRSTNQTKDRSLGVLYLQYGDETKQIRMPNEITSIDTIRALFVSAFPQQLTMKMLESPSVAVYVKDDMRNMYYELADVRNIAAHSCLKVYHKDPAQAFSHGPRPANGDARMLGEMAHPGREGQHPLRHPPMGPPPHHPMQGPLPPSSHPMPPSPSRIPFGSRQGSLPGSSTVPRERISNANPTTRSISPCPSAILERRDVKPDEGMAGKSHSLSRGNEGLYADPYMLQEGRIGMVAAPGSHPCPGLDGPEHGMAGFHRASIRSTGSYGGPSPTDTIDHPSLFRQKSRNSQLPTLGSKTPPPSPHRMTEVRMVDIHSGPPHGVPPHGVPPHGIPMERSSPVRQSFRKDDVSGTKPRNNMGPPVVPDLQGQTLGAIPAPSEDLTRERMKAMEQQIASLTGLVQHALLKGPNSSGTKEPASERPTKAPSPAGSAPSSGGSPDLAPKRNKPSSDKSSAPLKVNLLQFRRNVSDLRMQLYQMRQLQLQNQETVRVQLKRTEQEISVKFTEAMRRLEDPIQRQRSLVEEDRHKYLGLEEHVLTQLNELEQYVGSLQKDSATAQKVVTLKDVEEGAITLRKVGESLAGLKGEFPGLQTRMRAVLRVEVEAVKFLKEEPHKLDSMLKRVKTLTDTLSNMRRCSTEFSQRGRDCSTNVPVANSPATADCPAEALPAPVQAGLTPAAPPEPQSSTVKSEVMPSSPVVIHHVQSSPVLMQQSQQSAALMTQASPPPTPSHTVISSPSLSKTQGRESPKGAASNPQSPARHKKTPVNGGNGTAHQDLVIEELQNNKERSKNRTVSIEAAEKEWEEKRQNMGHYDGKEFEKILQEAQANMMKGIPNLETDESQLLPPAAAVGQGDVRNPPESPSEEPESGSPSDNPAKKGPEKPPKPPMEKPTKLSMERPSKTATKPAAADGLTKQGSDKPNKSPPPPPPRKTYSASNSGMTTTRSGEVVFTARKESVSAQEDEEDASPSSPHLKPTKVPPESKSKPATPPPVTAAVTMEEEDEGHKIMAELQNTSVASPTSRMPVPMSAKARQSPGATDKAGKQHKLQDAQRQFRQANGSAKRVGGDHKTTSPTIPISKIPAFYPSSAKGSSQSAQNPEATNSINQSSSSSFTTKSSILSSHTPRSGPQPSSHIPSLSNGSLKLPTPLQPTGKALSFSSQTQNGRVHSSSSSSSSSSYSSSPSPLSPTPLGPGGKSIRTIHTPSFTSYRSHNGSSGKSCIPTATAAKDSI